MTGSSITACIQSTMSTINQPRALASPLLDGFLFCNRFEPFAVSSRPTGIKQMHARSRQVRRFTQIWVAALSANMAVAAIGVTPTAAMTEVQESLLVAHVAPETKLDLVLPATKHRSVISGLSDPSVVKLAAGPKRKGRRARPSHTGQAQFQQARRRNVSQGGPSAIRAGQQGRNAQADGTFDSSDLISVFSAGGYND